MTDELTNQIRTEVYEAYQAGIDHQCVPFKYPPLSSEDIAETTETIIALVRADERKRIREALSEYANGFVVARTDSGEEIGAFGTLPVFQQIMEQAGLTEDES